MIHARAGFLLLLLLCCGAWHGPAAAAPKAASKAEAAYTAGVAAFRDGDYAAARDRFLEARRRGLDNPNLDLNLGLSHYRLGEYDRARECLEHIRYDLRYTAIADYHLGLMAADRGDRDEALRYLQSVQAVSPSKTLRDQASAALRRLDDVPLEERPATPEVAEPDGTYFVRAATGFDSNPELVSESLDRPVADDGAGYAEMIANLEHPLERTRLGTTLFRADLRARQHDGETGFDHQSGEVGLRQSWRAGDWRLGVGGEGGASWLDGEAYQGSGALVLDGRRRVGDVTLGLRGEAERIAGEGEYAYLDGWRQRVEVELGRSYGILRARLEAEAERNEREDLAVGEEFASYSPTRTGLAVAVGTPSLRRFSTEVRARYRASRYADANRFLEDGALREERRTDRLAALGLRLRLRNGPTWNWLVDYQYSRNDSSLDAFGYARHVAAFGIEWLK
jgi:tetratricopeptide (TPR) repeat protein